jgi:octaprenyl-diphosphate synthase
MSKATIAGTQTEDQIRDHRGNLAEAALLKLYAPIRDELEGLQSSIAATLHENRAELDEIDRYVFRRPGKMLRPALVLLAGMAARGDAGRAESIADLLPEADIEKLRNLALTMELLHSASLIHDDVLDRATERRNAPSANARYTDRIAVLAGDVLFSKAFGVLARHFGPEVTTPITDVTAGMCNGEIFAALLEDRKITLDEYYELIRMKTASFTAVCCYTAALSLGHPTAAAQLHSFGMEFGLAYQIVDDHHDGDDRLVEGFDIDLATVHALRAHEALRNLPPSQHVDRLSSFIDTVVAQVGGGSGGTE